jgi:N-acetylglucosamine kinase-like BadF-type ATPase
MKSKAAMGTDTAIERVKKELMRAFDNTRAELDRIEILAAGLAAFNTPVPNYEPSFRHLHHLNQSVHEFTSD